MLTKFGWQNKFRTPDALTLSHDEMRAELVRATTVPGRIGELAERVAHLCLPHFELEEQTVFPVFAILQRLASGEFEPEMASVLPLISEFSAKRQTLGEHHVAIGSGVWALLVATYKEDNREIAEFAYGLRAHERLEAEVIYPTILLIREFLQQRLRM